MEKMRPLKRKKTADTLTEAGSNENPLAPGTPNTPETATASKPRVPQTPPESRAAQDKSRSPWYRTWSRKAPPTTQMAAGSDATAEVAPTANAKTPDPQTGTRNPAAALTLGKSSLKRQVPVDTTKTNVHATQTANVATNPMRTTNSQTELLSQEGTANKTSDTTGDGHGNGAVEAQQEEKISETNTAGWFTWIAKRDSMATPTYNTDGKQPVANADNSENANGSSSTSASIAKNVPIDKDPGPSEPESVSPNNKRSWLQMLGGDASSKAAAPVPKTTVVNSSVSADPIARTKAIDITRPLAGDKSTDQSQASSLEALPPPSLPGDANKSSGWVFWSRDRKANPSNGASEDEPHIGELAISDTPSQNKPRRASISITKEETAKAEPKTPKPAEGSQKSASIKSGSGKRVDQDPPPPSTPAKKPSKEPEKDKAALSSLTVSKQNGSVKVDPKNAKVETANASAVAKDPTEITPVKSASSTSSRRSGPHMLLPSFRETLSPEESPSILQQLTRLLYSSKPPKFRHLSIIKDPPRIRSALAIGVHGYFPAPMLRTLLGQPTGTSIKFADMAAKAISRWTKSRGYECQVKTAALEGEGRIAERVELLWNLLINWVAEIRKADFVMVACHSQGVPVAIMLVAKLIQFGCIPAARISICAMAGVSMGPFVEYKSRWIGGSAGELFEFSDPSSRVSEDYVAALDSVLSAGVRLTYVGSIDDQLVSLESSIFAPVTHPHIFRAVSIDPRVHAPNFLSHLVGFVLKLRNLGAQDHGLIRELSSPLAGSLVTGEGHSRLYEDDAIYDLAVSFALETNSLPNIPIMYRRNQATAAVSSSNPYVLPFAMRGILEEEFARNKLRHEADDLLKQFDQWRPTTKALKDVKFRLEGIRSKL